MDHELKTLSRRELVDAIAWEIGITQAKAAPVVHATIEKIADALAKRRRVELRGLGVFEVVERKPRWTTDPNSGKNLVIPERYTVRFKRSKVLKPYHEMSFALDDAEVTNIYEVSWQPPRNDPDVKGAIRVTQRYFTELLEASRHGGKVVKTLSPYKFRVYTSRSLSEVEQYARKIDNIVFNGTAHFEVRQLGRGSEIPRRGGRREIGASMSNSDKLTLFFPSRQAIDGFMKAGFDREDPLFDPVSHGKIGGQWTVVVDLMPRVGRSVVMQLAKKFHGALGKDMGFSLTMNKSIKPEAALTFSSEKTARRFASMALARFPRAEVQCSGRKVRVKHGHRDAEGVYALAQRVHRKQPRRQVAMSAPPPKAQVNSGADQQSGDPVPQSIKVYFKKLDNAQRAVETFNKIGAQAKSDIDQVSNIARGHTVTVVGGDRAEVNRVIAELKGCPVPPEPRSNLKYGKDGMLTRGPITAQQLERGFAFAMGGGRITSDWKVSFGTQKKLTSAIYSALRKKDVSVTPAGQTGLVFHRMTHDDVQRVLASITVPGADISKSKFGDKPIRPIDHIFGPIQQVGDTVDEDPLKGTVYGDPKSTVKDVFKQLAVDVTAEVGTQKAMDLLKKFGVDLAVLGGGVIALAFHEAISRAVQQWLNQVGGKVLKSATVKGKPSVSSLRSWLGGLRGSQSARDAGHARAQAIRQGRQYQEPPQQGLFAKLFNRKSAQSPFAPGSSPPRTQGPTVTPSTTGEGYKVERGYKSRKKDIDKGIFSFAMGDEDYRAKHDEAVQHALNRQGHGRVKTFNKGSELHSHMTKGNYSPYTLITNKETGEQRRVQGHTSLPVARGTAEGAVKIAATTGGFMIKFTNKAFKTLAMLYATKLGIDILNQGVDYVVVREINLAKRLASVIASAVLRRPMRFSHKDDTIAGAAAPAGASMSKKSVACADWIGISYAVMDFLSDQATRAIADALVHHGIRVIRSGSNRLVATIKDEDQMTTVKSLAAKARAKLRWRRKDSGAGRQAKSASFGFGDSLLKLIDKILTKESMYGGRVFRAGVIPGGVVLLCASTIAASEVAYELAHRGLHAIARGAKVLVKGREEQKAASMAFKALINNKSMGFANEIIKRPKWTKVDSPVDDAWSKHEKARRAYAQGKGPRPRPYDSARTDDMPPWMDKAGRKYAKASRKYPALVGALTVVVAGAATAAVAAFVQSVAMDTAVVVKRGARKLVLKVMGAKTAEQIKKIAEQNGGTAKVAEHEAGMGFGLENMTSSDIMHSAHLIFITGGLVLTAVQKLKEARIKVQMQNERLAVVKATDAEELKKIADIVREEHLTVREELAHDRKARGRVFNTLAKTGGGLVGAVAAYVAFVRFRNSEAVRQFIHAAAQLGVKIIRKAADRDRGTVVVTQLSPEQLSQLKRAVQTSGGQIKRLEKSAGVGVSMSAMPNKQNQFLKDTGDVVAHTFKKRLSPKARKFVELYDNAKGVADKVTKPKSASMSFAEAQPLDQSDTFEKTVVPGPVLIGINT